MKKKLTVIVCVVLVALFAFAACGAPAAESSTSSAPAEESKAPAESSDSGTAESCLLYTSYCSLTNGCARIVAGNIFVRTTRATGCFHATGNGWARAGVSLQRHCIYILKKGVIYCLFFQFDELEFIN